MPCVPLEKPLVIANEATSRDTRQCRQRGRVKNKSEFITALLFTVYGLDDVANSLPDYFSEPGLNPTRSHATDPTGVGSIDPMTGVLRLSHTVILIPGNGGLDLVVQRNYQTSTAIGGAAGQLATNTRSILASTGISTLAGF
jgi:hypothetical protein